MNIPKNTKDSNNIKTTKMNLLKRNTQKNTVIIKKWNKKKQNKTRLRIKKQHKEKRAGKYLKPSQKSSHSLEISTILSNIWWLFLEDPQIRLMGQISSNTEENPKVNLPPKLVSYWALVHCCSWLCWAWAYLSPTRKLKKFTWQST